MIPKVCFSCLIGISIYLVLRASNCIFIRLPKYCSDGDFPFLSDVAQYRNSMSWTFEDIGDGLSVIAKRRFFRAVRGRMTRCNEFLENADVRVDEPTPTFCPFRFCVHNNQKLIRWNGPAHSICIRCQFFSGSSQGCRIAFGGLFWTDEQAGQGRTNVSIYLSTDNQYTHFLTKCFIFVIPMCM